MWRTVLFTRLYYVTKNFLYANKTPAFTSTLQLFLSAICNAFWNISSTNKESESFRIFWAQQLISTHHKRLHVVFTGSSKWMNYMYTLWLTSTDFLKTLRPSQKLRCQKCDIKGIHNLKFRHWLGVAAHKISKYLEYVCHLTQSSKWLSLLGDTWNAE